jgi:hypothetical protein
MRDDQERRATLGSSRRGQQRSSHLLSPALFSRRIPDAYRFFNIDIPVKNVRQCCHNFACTPTKHRFAITSPRPVSDQSPLQTHGLKRIAFIGTRAKQLAAPNLFLSGDI